MWRPWDTDSQGEQWDNHSVASDGIPVLVSDSDKSVIFDVEKPSPSVQGSGIIMRATIQAIPIPW